MLAGQGCSTSCGAAEPRPCRIRYPALPPPPCQVMFMNPWSLIVLAVLALLWGYAYMVRTTPLVLGGRELRCAAALHLAAAAAVPLVLCCWVAVAAMRSALDMSAALLACREL